MTWLLIILCGVITFLIRFIPLSGIISSDLPLFVKQSFKYIPLAVLTPIIVSDLSIIENKNLAKVSIVGIGMKTHAGVAQKMFETLSQENININVISTSEIKISVLIKEDLTQKAVKALHKTFGLN